ncbi:MAG: porin [Pseudoxanthomonas sp.]
MRSGLNANNRKGTRAWLAGALTCAFVLPASAQEKLTLEQLQLRLEALERRVSGPADTAGEPSDVEEPALADLDQRLRLLERKLQLQQDEPVVMANDAPVIAVNDKGASFKSASGDYEVRIRGLIQGDGRFFLDGAPSSNDTFLLRTARPIIEGTLGKLVAFRLTPEFAGDSVSIVDAYVDLRFDPAYTVRAGKFTSPVGLERLQSSSALADVERALPSELAPNRDIGIQLHGDVAQGRVSYALGVFNGTVDGRDAVTSNPDNEFEYAGRIFFEPFKNEDNAWAGLGFGIGASVGDKQGNGNNFLPRYRTPGQVQFFNYLGTVLADGRQSRLSPQGYYYRNGFGLLAEYIVSSQEVSLGGVRDEFSHKAWQATASYVLTGEDASYRGAVKPSQPFNPGQGSWGAVELVGRYGVLEVDEDAFPLFADPARSSSEASSWTLGLNWYLNSNLKLVANYLQTRLEGGAPGGADRETEKAVFTRMQVAF